MTIAFRQMTLCPKCGYEHTADMPFGRWLREQGRIGCRLPSSVFVASDCDFILHRYKTEVDGIGSREFQHIGIIEVKTFKREVDYAQDCILGKTHERLYGDGYPVEREGVFIKHWGVSVVRFESDTPDSGRVMWQPYATGKRHLIAKDMLIDLLAFERHWGNMKQNPVSRHHKTQDLYVTETAPLGFDVDKVITKRS